MHLYNEFDRKAAAWLGQLTGLNIIPNGNIDTRSICDVRPSDLVGFTQCHFFAGIGGWSEALRLAGWPEDRPVWTGSCPCQPFSAAGKQMGEADERHLWPEFRRLVAECRPPVVFGEQVASSLGRQWLAGVRSDLEALGYAVGAADLCAAGVGAPHIRQRLYWGGVRVGDTNSFREEWSRTAQRQFDATGKANRLANCCCSGLQERVSDGGVQSGAVGARSGQTVVGSRDASRVDDSPGSRLTPEGRGQPGESERGRGLLGLGCEVGGVEHSPGDGRIKRRTEPSERSVAGGRCSGGMVDSESFGLLRREDDHDGGRRERSSGQAGDDQSGFWSRYSIVHCRDGKARRFEPESFPLAHGVPGRVGLLRGYGNAIVPQVAARFIRNFCEAVRDAVA